MLLRWIATVFVTLLLLVGNEAVAELSVPSLPGGVRIQFRPDQPGGVSTNAVASGTCGVTVINRSVLLHFSASAFEHVDDASVRSDLILRGFGRNRIGRIRLTPSAALDSTRVASGKDHADLVFAIDQNGRTNLGIEVELSNPLDAAAGNYASTMVLTVTGD